MRVLVTGASGFLGQAVTAALYEAGHRTWAIDSVPGFKGDGLTADITKSLELKGSASRGVDSVVHMAAIAAPRTCEEDPGLAYNVNVNGTHQVIKLAIESGAKKFIFISSAHVYGISPKYLPTDERHPLQPQETYTTTKILGEKLCELYHENYGLNYTTLRLFNAYGPGQLPGYFIPDMIVKARDGGITLGGGETTKDFVYVDDVVKAILLALETSYVGPINIGTGVQTPLNNVAMMIADHFGATFDGTTISTDSLPTRMMADWDRAKQILGWEPSMNIEDGLRATIESESLV